tara:strand:+ start:722 stop:2422 length:1701 start_codon:yes stop_codon:yes gene_type:complete
MRRYPERDGPIEGEIPATLKGLAQGATTDLGGGILDAGAAITGAASEIDPSVQAFSPTASALSAANPFLQGLVDKYGSEALGEAIYGKEDTPLLQKIRDDARLIGGVAGLGEMATAKAAKFTAEGIGDFMRFLPNVRPQAVTPDGQIIPLPNESLPNTSVMSMSSDDFTSGLKNLQSSKSKILSLTDRDEAFEATANLQRGTPEVQMVNTQRLMGGGVLSYAIEHGGDLLHRMTDRGGRAALEDTAPKVKSLIRSLESEYGFGREFTENMRNNYRSKLEAAKSQGEEFYPTFEDYEDAVLKNLDNYAAYHSQLPVFNELQQAARDTAISLGKRDFDGALDNLRILDDAIEDGSFVERNRSFDPEFETKAADQSSTLYRSEAASYENPNEGAIFYTPDKSYSDLYASEDRVLRKTSLPADVFDIREPRNSEAVLNWVNQKVSNLEDLSGASVDIRDVYAGIEQGGPQGASRALAAYNNILSKQAERSIIPGQAEKMFMQDFGVDAMTIKEAGRDLDEYSVAFKDVPVDKAEGGVITLADAARNTGRGPMGVASLASTARNMNRPMVS